MADDHPSELDLIGETRRNWNERGIREPGRVDDLGVCFDAMGDIAQAVDAGVTFGIEG